MNGEREWLAEQRVFILSAMADTGSQRKVVAEAVTDEGARDRLGELGSGILSIASAAHRLRRTAADTLELSTPEGTLLLDGAWPSVFRARSLPLPRGAVVRTSYMIATVLDDRAGAPRACRFSSPGRSTTRR